VHLLSLRAPLLALAAALLALPAAAQRPAAPQAPAGAIAIIVHAAVPVENLSFGELRRYFLGDRQYWPDRSRVTLLVRAPVAAERSVVLSRIYQMDEARFRRYWIAKMFRAEVAADPKLVYSSEGAQNLVAMIPGAITFMPAAARVGPGVKVLRIDGKLPADAGYPLQ
jgi:hypothetical protein